MEKSINITYLMLICLTLLTAIISSLAPVSGKMLALLIMGIAAMKFLLVAFDFLELKKAHGFWKFATVLVCVIIAGVFGLFSIG